MKREHLAKENDCGRSGGQKSTASGPLGRQNAERPQPRDFCLAVRTLMMPFAMAARRNSVLPVPRPAKNWLRGRVPDKRQLG